MRKIEKLGLWSKMFLLLSIFSLTAIGAFAQSVKGVVKDQNGDAVIGATVKVEGTSTGTVTDASGNFSLNTKGKSTISVSSIGYITQKVNVNGKSNVSVVLQEDNAMLNDLVVIGYGVQKKSDLTGAVASIKSDDLKGLSTSDAAAALQGKASGLQVINSGSPGAGAEIRVRGYSSNSTSGQGPLLIVDGLKVDNIQYLDPSMIESVEVLKDAASAAIYGAQAGNGVVLVTTKSGANSGGQAKVSYTLKAINQRLGKKAEIFNAADYIEYQEYIEMLSEKRLTDNGYDGQDTDWYDEVFGNSWAVQHNITVQGGNQKGHFLADLGILNNNGIVKGDKDVYKRLSGQINADYQLFKWLNVKTSNNIEKWSTKSVGNGYQSMLNSVVSIDPLTPAYVYKQDDMGIGMKSQWALENHGNVLTPPEYTDANPVWYGTSKYAQDGTGNPLAMRDRSKAESNGINLRGSAEANLTPVDGLTVTSRLGYRVIQQNSHDSATPWWLNGKNAQSSTYSISAETDASYYYQWENFANYLKTFGKHTVGAMIGMSYTKTHADNTSVSSTSTSAILNGDGASNFNYIDYLNDTGKANLSVSNAPTETTSLSYFGRLSYSYDERYFFQANFRRDAFDSSKLSKSARWGNFPSFSAGWAISNEKFFKNNVNSDAVSYLKIRASWGRNGNIAPLSGYQYASTIGIGGYYQFESGTLTTAGAPGKMANPDLKWETSEQLDFGLDARFLSNRLSLGFDWYRKTTKDLLVQVTGIPEIGGQNSWVNTGKVLNTGVDIELGWHDHIGELQYGVTANFSPLKNEVLEVSSVYPRITETGISGFNNKMQPTFEKGHSVWYFRGFKYAGVYSEDLYTGTFDKANVGKAVYYDKNGALTMAPTEDDKQDLGCAIPKFTYGVTVNLAYKGFDFTMFCTGAAGNKIYNLMVSADTPETNGLNVYWKDSWRTDNNGNVIATGKYPNMKYVATDWTFYSSSAALFSGSYFKFKQIQLGYTVPNSLTKKFYVSDLRFSVSLDDFFTITSYPGADPETSSLNSGASRGFDNGNYPMSKKIVFGVNLSF